MNLAIKKKGFLNTTKRLNPVFLIYTWWQRRSLVFPVLPLLRMWRQSEAFHRSCQMWLSSQFLFLNTCISEFWFTTAVRLGLDLLEWLSRERSWVCPELSSGWGTCHVRELGISTSRAASLAVNVQLFNLLQFPGECSWATLIFSLSCLSPPCSLLSLSFHARFPLPGLNVESVLN